MNPLREKLTSQPMLFGTHVSLGSAAVCDILGNVGFDYIWIDMEHTTLTCEQVYVHIQMARARGTAAIVRVPVDDYVTLKRILEIGPDGIVFPMVRDAAHARQLLQYTCYPPRGTRGFGPRAAIRYGMSDVNEYIEKGSMELCRFVQIETRSAYEDLDAILAEELVDGVVIGPCDLAGQYGKLTDTMNEEMLRRVADIAARARAAGKRAGFSVGDSDRETLSKWLSLGLDMISAGADTTSLWFCARETLHNLQCAAQEAAE